MLQRARSACVYVHGFDAWVSSEYVLAYIIVLVCESYVSMSRRCGTRASV